jgi:hypothetical protein
MGFYPEALKFYRSGKCISLRSKEISLHKTRTSFDGIRDEAGKIRRAFWDSVLSKKM